MIASTRNAPFVGPVWPWDFLGCAANPYVTSPSARLQSTPGATSPPVLATTPLFLRLNMDDDLQEIREPALEEGFYACGQIVRLSNTQVG